MVFDKPGLMDDKSSLAVSGDQAIIIYNSHDAAIGQAGKPRSRGL